MASLQFARRLHLQHYHHARNKLLKRLKGLVGLGSNQDIVENVKIQQTGLEKNEFMFESVPERIATVVAQSLPAISNVDRNRKELPLIDITSKYKLIKGCHEEFGVVPPNNIVNESKSVEDFVRYYTNLKKPHVIEEILQFEKKKLPINLTFEGHLPFKPAKRKSI